MMGVLMALMTTISLTPAAIAQNNATSNGTIQENEDVLTLDWADLIPEKERVQFDKQGFMLNQPGSSHQGDSQAEQSMAVGVRSELHNSQVKISGFVIPLEGDENSITEFLLVPYFGACIHVPPPPPNQLLLVSFPEGAPIAELWDIVNVTGTLKVEQNDIEGIHAYYGMEGLKIEPYEDEEY
ncbi:DUF3299 domain-containing protein [Vibrio sp.]|nr:DUF3299 domain-containing protein [Vibrio sp.]